MSAEKALEILACLAGEIAGKRAARETANVNP